MPRCIYCDALANSPEHILASCLGGQLVSSDLICAHHNTLASKADQVLCEQFEFARHCLDVKTGRDKRGAKFTGLFRPSGKKVSIGRNRLTEVLDIRDSGQRIEIEGSDFPQIHKKSKQIEAMKGSPKLISTWIEEKTERLRVDIQVGGEGSRGILKTAFHLGAHLIRRRELSSRGRQNDWPTHISERRA